MTAVVNTGLMLNFKMPAYLAHNSTDCYLERRERVRRVKNPQEKCVDQERLENPTADPDQENKDGKLNKNELILYFI